MEIYNIPHNITVFGNPVESFPNGIGEAFDKLISELPANDKRQYYGISWCAGNDVTYVAAAEEKTQGEANKYGYETFTIEKGNYLSIVVPDWQAKTATIKKVFEEIMQDERADIKTPAIEIYKDDKEMVCLIALKRSIENLDEYEHTITDLLEIVNEFDENNINKKPNKESWSAAQVLVHVTKSNTGIARAMKLDGEKLPREADQRIAEIKNTFLDFTVKFKSPDFILPEEGPFEKTALIKNLNDSIQQLKENSKNTDLSLAIKHPAFGEITKLELLHFVLFHMQRHTRQLNNIYKEIITPSFLSN